MCHLSRFSFTLAVAALFVTACSRNPSDDAIATQIKATFFSDPIVKLATINVAVSKGEVTLAGAVSGAEVELKALTLASATEGVRHLNDRITIAPAAAHREPDAMALAGTDRKKLAGPKYEYPWPQEQGPQEPQEAQRFDDQAQALPAEPGGEAAPAQVALLDASLTDTPALPDAAPDTSASNGGSFDRSVTVQPTAASRNLTGAGAPFPAPLYRKWFSEYQTLGDLRIDYQVNGSGDGIKDVTEGLTDFGASDIILSTQEFQAFRSRNAGRALIAFPTVVGAVIPIYNLPGVKADVNFSGAVLAAIYLGKITKWNDPALVELNPLANLPNMPITALHRADGSGTTFCFTDYLSKVSPEWQQSVGRSALVNWPAGLGAIGNVGVAALLDQTHGALGFVDLTYAAKNHRPYGKVLNPSGEYVKADFSTVSAAAAAIKELVAGTQISITNSAGKGVYPISYFTWLLVPNAFKDSSKAFAMRGFLHWALTGGQREAESLKYARLPKAVAATVEQQIVLIR